RACGIAESLAAKDGGLRGFVSLGWAGALSCGLSVGSPYWVAEVVDGGTEERFPTKSAENLQPPLTLVTAGYIAQPEEKRVLAERFHAVLVDMEAAAVGRVALDKGIPFYCLKAISDAQ